MALVKVYTVQPLWVALAIMEGNYVPTLEKSFASEHELFMDAYMDMRSFYVRQCGIPFLENETGLWGYTSHEVIDKASIKPDKVLCEITIDDRFLLESSYTVWESILDGTGNVYVNNRELFFSESGLKQVYFSSGVVENLEIMKNPIFL